MLFPSKDEYSSVEYFVCLKKEGCTYGVVRVFCPVHNKLCTVAQQDYILFVYNVPHDVHMTFYVWGGEVIDREMYARNVDINAPCTTK